MTVCVIHHRVLQKASFLLAVAVISCAQLLLKLCFFDRRYSVLRHKIDFGEVFVSQFIGPQQLLESTRNLYSPGITLHRQTREAHLHRQSSSLQVISQQTVSRLPNAYPVANSSRIFGIISTYTIILRKAFIKHQCCL